MYIRTKNKIYQVESTLRDNGFVKGYNVGYMAFITKDQVIKQADTIEELCDEFIDIIPRENGKAYHDHWEWSVEEKRFNNDIGESVPFDYFSDNTYFRGAIWTDKGLIYVAKMNSDGKLVLI